MQLWIAAKRCGIFVLVSACVSVCVCWCAMQCDSRIILCCRWMHFIIVTVMWRLEGASMEDIDLGTFDIPISSLSPSTELCALENPRRNASQSTKIHCVDSPIKRKTEEEEEVETKKKLIKKNYKRRNLGCANRCDFSSTARNNTHRRPFVLRAMNNHPSNNCLGCYCSPSTVSRRVISQMRVTLWCATNILFLFSKSDKKYG